MLIVYANERTANIVGKREEEKSVDRAGAAFSKPWSLAVCSEVFLDIGRLMSMWQGPQGIRAVVWDVGSRTQVLSDFGVAKVLCD